jgi:uncharacterized membrane protein
VRLRDWTGRRETSNRTTRIEALSDGIFAIAMTLLVLDIKVPEADGPGGLLDALGRQWPDYFAFVVGFFTLLVCWINHHYMFEHIVRSDGVLLLLNGLKILVVSFTPFVTALLSHYIETDALRVAVIVYTGNFFAMGLTMTGIWCYADGRGYTAGASPAQLRTATRYYLFTPVLAGLIFATAFASVWVSLVLFVLMFVVYVFPARTVALLTPASPTDPPDGEISPDDALADLGRS